MEDTSSLIPLVYPHLFNPILAKMGGGDGVQKSLLALEKVSPGASLDLLIEILKRSEVNCSVHEAILREQASAQDDASHLTSFKLSRGEESVRGLMRQLTHLKQILGRIPYQIKTDRTPFLATIKETAGSIKGILDMIEQVSTMLPNPSARSLLDLQKREFVKYSKRFSLTLQGYFRDGMEKPVYVSALLIINQANVITSTMKEL